MNNPSQDSPLRALLVEDPSEQRARLVSILETEGDIGVECLSTSDDAVQRVATMRPDVVILDLQSHGGHPTRAIEQIMAHNPTPILVLSVRIHNRHSPSAVEALVAGALDALPRPDDLPQRRPCDRVAQRVADEPLRWRRHRQAPWLDDRRPAGR